MNVLLFEIASERYGIPAVNVQEIFRAVAVTRVPRLPETVSGVVDVRGELLPVLDMRRRFELPPRGVAPEDHFIRALAAGRTVLLHVDRADRVAELPVTELTPVGAAAGGMVSVAGVGRTAAGLVLIHDVDAFLSAEEVIRVEAAIRAAGDDAGATN